MPVDKFGRMSDTKTKDTGVSLPYINNNYIRSDGSTPVSGSIDMRGNTLYNVSDPVNPQDVATKEYADKVGGGETAIIKTRYGTYGAIGNIDMRGYTLTNVLDPADAQDVATKQYVDNKRTHIIVAHGSYYGDLIKDRYQFSFGGNNLTTYRRHDIFNGFLMPHNGYIKRFVLDDTGFKFASNKYTNFVDYIKSLDNTTPIFTLVLIKPTNEIIELGTLNMHITINEGNPITYFSHYLFISTGAGELEEYKLNANDILNIRSEISTINLEGYFQLSGGRVREGYRIDNFSNQFYTYLVSILIELDPL